MEEAVEEVLRDLRVWVKAIAWQSKSLPLPLQNQTIREAGSQVGHPSQISLFAWKAVAKDTSGEQESQRLCRGTTLPCIDW